jgi:hypothetical protein
MSNQDAVRKLIGKSALAFEKIRKDMMKVGLDAESASEVFRALGTLLTKEREYFETISGVTLDAPAAAHPTPTTSVVETMRAAREVPAAQPPLAHLPSVAQRPPRPEGYLVGTKRTEIVYAPGPKPVERRKEDPLETPHPVHGGIVEAGFIEE